MLSKAKFVLLAFMTTFLCAEVKVAMKNDIDDFTLAVGEEEWKKIKGKFTEWKYAMINLLKNLLNKNEDLKNKNLKELINKLSKGSEVIFTDELEDGLYEFYLRYFQELDEIEAKWLRMNRDVFRENYIPSVSGLKFIRSLKSINPIFYKMAQSIGLTQVKYDLLKPESYYTSQPSVWEDLAKSKSNYESVWSNLHESFPEDPKQLSIFLNPIAVCVDSSTVLFDNPNQEYKDTVYLTGVRAFYNAYNSGKPEKYIYVSDIKGKTNPSKTFSMILIKLNFVRTAMNFIPPQLEEIVLFDSPGFKYPIPAEDIDLAIKNVCENILQVCKEWKNLFDGETKAKENAGKILDGVKSALEKEAQENIKTERNLITSEFLLKLASKIDEFITKNDLRIPTK